MEMPGRGFSSEKYRFSINGQEKTPEIFEGSTTALYWEYDSRIGRRWNIDPKSSASYSVYAVFENSPIWKSDVLGDTIKPLQLSASQERALNRTRTNASESTCQGCHLKTTLNTNVPIRRPVAYPAVGPLSAEVRNRTPEERKKVEATIKFIAGIQKSERERAEDHRAADDIPGVGTIMRGLRRGVSGDIDGMALLTTKGAVEVAGMYSGGSAIVDGIKGISNLGTISTEGAATTGATGTQYSVAFETKLANNLYPGKGPYSHFQAANTALADAMASDATFANSMKQLGITVPRSNAGTITGGKIQNWVWHHSTQPGVMQLVPQVQHTNGSILWNTLHPGGRGGMSIWGGGYR